MGCVICNSNASVDVIDAKEVFTKNRFKYSKCKECGALQLTDVPENISDYYANNYYSLTTVSEDSLMGKLKSVRDRFTITQKGFAGKLLSSFMPNDTLRALKHLNLQPTDRLLDVGCGTGKEIRLLRKFGYKNAIGIDPFISEDIHDEAGLLVKKAGLEDVEGQFDLITLHHSFEHMNEPERILNLLNKLLAENGTVMIRIPLADSYAFKKYGTDWVQLDAPRHSFLHTKQSMKILSERSGFKNMNVVYDSRAFQFWASEVNKKGISIHTLGSLRSIKFKVVSFFKRYAALAEQCNRNQNGDQAMFLLKKI
jgi:SAM-dependent methyltransferase